MSGDSILYDKKKCTSENYRYDENSSSAGAYRCYNDCMCDGRRKCFTWDPKLSGICTGNAQTGKFAGCAPNFTPPEGHMFNLVSPLATYLPPSLNQKEKATLRCVWNR